MKLRRIESTNSITLYISFEWFIGIELAGAGAGAI